MFVYGVSQLVRAILKSRAGGISPPYLPSPKVWQRNFVAQIDYNCYALQILHLVPEVENHGIRAISNDTNVNCPLK